MPKSKVGKRRTPLLDIRSHYRMADGMKAGKGISLQRSQIVTLRKALQQAERALKDEKNAVPVAETEE